MGRHHLAGHAGAIVVDNDIGAIAAKADAPGAGIAGVLDQLPDPDGVVVAVAPGFHQAQRQELTDVAVVAVVAVVLSAGWGGNVSKGDHAVSMTRRAAGVDSRGRLS